MLEVGFDSYVTVADADAYVQRQYSSFEPEAVSWEVLTDRDKEAFLRQSLDEVDALMYAGEKCNRFQQLAFPRLGFGPVVPAAVKDAQADNAVAIMRDLFGKRGDRQFRTLSALGAQQNVKYNKRNNDLGADAVAPGNAAQTPAAVRTLHSERAERLLRPFLGSYRMG
jgi:hypothetical protein